MRPPNPNAADMPPVAEVDAVGNRRVDQGDFDFRSVIAVASIWVLFYALMLIKVVFDQDAKVLLTSVF